MTRVLFSTLFAAIAACAAAAAVWHLGNDAWFAALEAHAPSLWPVSDVEERFNDVVAAALVLFSMPAALSMAFAVTYAGCLAGLSWLHHRPTTQGTR